MRILVVLICSLALVSVHGAQKQEDKSKQKKQTQPAQQASQATRQSTGARAAKKTPNTSYQGQNARNAQTSPAAYDAQKAKKNQTSTRAYEGRKAKQGQTLTAASEGQKGKKNQTQVERQAAKRGEVKEGGKRGQTPAATQAGNRMAKSKAAAGKPIKPQHFNVPKQPNTAKAPSVKFQQGKRIEGSQNWQGASYTVFRNYTPQWHDQGWWHSHHNRIVFVFGAPYYWNAGYWFPAWGFYPNAYYAWDGPIYAYNNLPPDQVIANVQSALQQQGYYRGEVDGLIGPLTRGAIADYQRDHGLYETAAIDQPTLQTLGMS